MLDKIDCRKFSEEFLFGRRFGSAEILCVFQAFKPRERMKRTAEDRQDILESMPYKKGSGAKSIAPHFSPVSRTANSTARFVRVVA
jgi:hypothetical protein